MVFIDEGLRLYRVTHRVWDGIGTGGVCYGLRIIFDRF